MARKKKTTSTVEKEKTTKSGMSVGYQGKLTVKINKGDNTISTKTYHNTGTYKMFKFICDSLAGADASKRRPCQIRLFTKNDSEEADKQTTWKFTEELGSSPVIATASTSITSTPIKDSSGQKVSDAAAVTYTFKIPFAYLYNDIYKAALYGSSIGDYDTDKAAYFGFISEDPTPAWSPIVLEDRSGNYSLIIEWTIVISNLYNVG